MLDRNYLNLICIYASLIVAIVITHYFVRTSSSRAKVQKSSESQSVTPQTDKPMDPILPKRRVGFHDSSMDLRLPMAAPPSMLL